MKLDEAGRTGQMATALWFNSPGICSLREEHLPEIDGEQLRLRTLFSGISRGTERLVFQGKVPVSEMERMRGPNMGGTFAFPVKYGYSLVGLVDEGPDHLIGKHVFALHPHQDRCVITASEVTLLPATLSPRRAVLAANMETALNIVWDSGIQPGDRVAVYGAGVVGALVAHLASRMPGTETLLIETDCSKQKLAADLDLPFAEPADVTDDFDVLINATASEDALQHAIEHAAVEAKIVEASWYGDHIVTLPLGGAFHSRRLSIVSSQVGAVPASRQARWTFARRIAKALDLLLDDRLEHLLSGETLFADIPAEYAKVLSAHTTLCHVIRY